MGASGCNSTSGFGPPRLQLDDFDVVEVANVTMQGYWRRDVERPKVEATGEAYRSGKIRRRQLAGSLCSSGGGITGKTVGAAGGAWAGTFGGPLAWATVPAGTVIGGYTGY